MHVPAMAPASFQGVDHAEKQGREESPKKKPSDSGGPKCTTRSLYPGRFWGGRG